MALNSQTKTLLAIAAILIVIYLIWMFYKQNQPKNEDNGLGSLPQNIDNEELEGYENASQLLPENGENEDTDNTNNPDYEHTEEQQNCNDSDWLIKKFKNKNQSKNGKFKRSSYNAGDRNAKGPGDWENYFDNNNNVMAETEQCNNDKFIPMDGTGGGYATFKSTGKETCGSNQNCDPEDLFDIDKYLPQQKVKGWFETPEEPISVKNRHLINTTKPIGINTVGGSKRNASRDLRGTIPVPKFNVSPFLNSTIEPDTNNKGFA